MQALIQQELSDIQQAADLSIEVILALSTLINRAFYLDLLSLQLEITLTVIDKKRDLCPPGRWMVITAAEDNIGHLASP